MKKILMVNYVFPPIPYAGTYRSLRLCREFQKRGIETHVLTINVYNDIPNDNTLLEKVPKQVSIHRTPIIDPWRWFQRWKNRHENMWGFKYINKIASILLWFFCLPDHMVLWIPFALVRGIRIIREHGIETVYVSSPPHSTQIIGLLLKKICTVRLIADFRDPIIGNAYDNSFKDNTDMVSRVDGFLKVHLERMIVDHADKVVVNTETHCREMLVRHGKDKFVTVRNSLDKGDYDGINGSQYETFTIAHVGSMYGLRKPDVLFKAIKRFAETIGDKPLKVQVLFVGINDHKLIDEIPRNGLSNYVKVLPMVPHHEAIEIMMRSHLLLLIKATGQGCLGQIPGKFFEYIGTGNKILYLGPLKSEVAEIIKEMRLGYIIEDNEIELAEILSKAYDEFLAGITRKLMPAKVDVFSSETMAKKIIELL